MSIVPKRKPLKKVNPWNRDNAAAAKLAQAKKAAIANQRPRESWWATPAISRAEFYSRVEARHREILNSASDGTRSLGKAI